VAAKQVVDKSAATVQDVNVAEVQSILTSEFDQLIHLPKPEPPSPPPADCPQYYNVSGAGDARWNGHYMRDARPHVALTYLSTTCAGCSLYVYGGVWRLGINGKEVAYIESAPTPLPATGPAKWQVAAAGKAPAPTLSAGPI
jgi:hypothetical protein